MNQRKLASNHFPATIMGSVINYPDFEVARRRVRENRTQAMLQKFASIPIYDNNREVHLFKVFSVHID
jgi:hypothetical protein